MKHIIFRPYSESTDNLMLGLIPFTEAHAKNYQKLLDLVWTWTTESALFSAEFTASFHILENLPDSWEEIEWHLDEKGSPFIIDVDIESLDIEQMDYTFVKVYGGGDIAFSGHIKNGCTVECLSFNLNALVDLSRNDDLIGRYYIDQEDSGDLVMEVMALSGESRADVWVSPIDSDRTWARGAMAIKRLVEEYDD